MPLGAADPPAAEVRSSGGLLQATVGESPLYLWLEE
jgi:hypothetical protein